MEFTITRDLLRKIAGALDENNLPDSSHIFAVDDMPMENIRIEIDKVGELAFPLSDDCMEKLVDISTKARFGSGEQTLLDENIRDTHEIAADKLHISFNQEALDRMMDKLRNGLGLDDNCVLSPHLHNMLIYGPGQFFDMHQDSEKLENMVGTLVIVLPNAHIGGDLIIELGGKKQVFSSESLKPVNAKCVAFYADCNHEIEKVKEGNRIALTFNVVLKAKEPFLSSVVNRRLLEAVKEYFDLKKDQQKLVYFLNHSYSEHGLKWNILKGEDRSNCLALRSVAEELGLIPHLVLVEVQETYNIESCIWSHLGKSSDDLKHGICRDVTLSFWVDSDNNKVSFSKCHILDGEICSTKDTYLFEPYEKQYEEFTGNAGNTMDYWYRRAGIVLWSESDNFCMSFRLGYDHSLGKLYELCKMPGNQKKVEEIIVQAGNYISKSNSGSNEKNNALKLAGIALYIENSDTAFSLLMNLKWEILSNDFAEKLANLQLKYGKKWCINLLNKMKTNSYLTSLNHIDLLIRSILEYNGDISIIKLILKIQYETITKEITRDKEITLLIFKSTLDERMKKLYEFIMACLICEDVSLLSKIIPLIISDTQQFPLTSLAAMYFDVYENTQPEKRDHFKELRDYLTKTIDLRVKSGVQSETDWSINFKLSCKCKICATATSFLNSKTEKTKRWPLREKARNHIFVPLFKMGLPLDVTFEPGSLFKLILVKTDALHKNSSEEFEKLKLCQQKLRALNK